MNNDQNDKRAGDKKNNKSSKPNKNPNNRRKRSVSRRRQYFLAAVMIALCIGGAAILKMRVGSWRSGAENTDSGGEVSGTEGASAATGGAAPADEKDGSEEQTAAPGETGQSAETASDVSPELLQAARREGALTVYGSCEEAYLSAACAQFEALYGIRVRFERLPASEVYTRARDAGGAPQADVWFGGSAAVCREAVKDGLLEAYAAENAGQLMDEEYRDAEGYWYGIDRDLLGFMVNRERLSERGAEVPQRWDALTEEIYRGMLAMPNPNIAPAAKQLLCMAAEQRGEAAAMEYFRALDQNVMQYTENDAKPAELAVSGACAVGICFLRDGIAALRGTEGMAAEEPAAEAAATKEAAVGEKPYADRTEGTPPVAGAAPSAMNRACVLVLPEDGSLSVLRATAIFRGCAHPNAARLWTEYALSPACVELAEKNTAYAFPVIASAAQPEEVQRFQLDVARQNPRMIYDSDIADTDGTALVNAFFEMIGSSAESPGFERFRTE